MGKQKRYENIHGLREKVIEFEMDNLQKICNDVFKELYEHNKETFYELKKAKESFEELKKVDKTPYYSDEYDLIKELESPLKKQFIEMLKTKLKVKKLDFNIESFYIFLSNSLKVEVSDLKKLFNNTLNDLIEIMNEYSIASLCIDEVINYYEKEVDFTPIINEKIYMDLPHINYIENKYNANVNCFNLTGKYIKDFDKNSFENKHPEVFYYFEYAQVVGLFDEYDPYYIVNEDRNNGGDEDPYTPEEYCYIAFYKNSPNMYNEIICINYLKDKIEKLNLLDHIDICDLEYLMLDLKKTKFNTKEPEKFKKDIDAFIASYDLSKSPLYTDSNNVIANSNPDYPGSGEGGRGSM